MTIRKLVTRRARMRLDEVEVVRLEFMGAGEC